MLLDDCFDFDEIFVDEIGIKSQWQIGNRRRRVSDALSTVIGWIHSTATSSTTGCAGDCAVIIIAADIAGVVGYCLRRASVIMDGDGLLVWQFPSSTIEQMRTGWFVHWSITTGHPALKERVVSMKTSLIGGQTVIDAALGWRWTFCAGNLFFDILEDAVIGCLANASPSMVWLLSVDKTSAGILIGIRRLDSPAEASPIAEIGPQRHCATISTRLWGSVQWPGYAFLFAKMKMREL